MWRSQRGVDATEEQGTKYRNSALQVRADPCLRCSGPSQPEVRQRLH